MTATSKELDTDTPLARGRNSRVQTSYNLSVPNVFFIDLALPTVPQSQRDTLIWPDC
jgi:hypothetical protein